MLYGSLTTIVPPYEYNITAIKEIAKTSKTINTK